MSLEILKIKLIKMIIITLLTIIFTLLFPVIYFHRDQILENIKNKIKRTSQN